ncbi:MAG: hypothetical protein H0V44_12005 [Planctomycetes bacterium]|nr:hypothetical protein [Planctomycetota bacterium]
MAEASCDRVSAAVFAALAGALGLTADEVARRRAEGLDRLGLDSHGLMRVLLEIERVLQLPALDLADSALESPATLAAGVAAATRGG